jgi:hypothetical protein
MKPLAAFFGELLGLFVEDGALALAIAAIVVLAGLSAAIVPRVPMATGAILLVGCLTVLFVNVIKARRR